MKKALAILSALALVGSVAFADGAAVSVGAWGRGVFAVESTGVSGDKITQTNKASWGGAPRIGFTLAGNTDNVGVSADLLFDQNSGTPSLGDQQFIWVKPLSMLKLSLGRVQVDALRGNAAFGSWNWDRAYGDGSFGEDFVFARLSTGIGSSATYDNKQGVVAEFTPISALYVGVALRDVNGANNKSAALTEDLFQNGQYAIGYTIENVGQIRAQYIGYYDAADTTKKGDIQAAFKLSAVPNLYADVGYAQNLADNSMKNISLYGNYKVDAATIHLAGRVGLPSSGDLGLYGALGLDYSLADGVGINADVRYTNKVLASDNTVTFMLGATKGFSNGLIGIGFEGKNAGSTFGFSVPVRFEYWF